jgi:CheY-like chemotaxis protein
MSGNQILVVDDEPLVLESVRISLCHYGYSVVTAGGALEALERLRQTEFGLMVTDRKMPTMTGEQLAAQVKLSWPRLPIIMLTGFPLEIKPDGVDVVLLKPFSTTGLRSAVDALLTKGQS